MSKRSFDLLACILTIPLWAPLFLVCAFAILLTSGWPVFYVSRRRVHGSSCISLIKFRVMVRNADQVANRDTIPIQGERFLNIPSDSLLYTGVGRWIERFALTELPQNFHVLSGQMSAIGNRPLPENVVEALREVFPNVEERFRTKAGLTGPVQLVGRDCVDDARRLRLEIAYCRICEESYSPRLDFFIALNTGLICLGLRKSLTIDAVEQIMERLAGVSLHLPETAQEAPPAALEPLNDHLMVPHSSEATPPEPPQAHKKKKKTAEA